MEQTNAENIRAVLVEIREINTRLAAIEKKQNFAAGVVAGAIVLVSAGWALLLAIANFFGKPN